MIGCEVDVKKFAIGVVMATMAMGADASVTRADWGKLPDGQAVAIYTLKSGDVEARVSTFGAKLVSVRTPDSKGHVADVVLGYDSVDGYVADRKTYFGSIVGRYGNRLAGGNFAIDGKNYQVPQNDHGNSLHGGTEGFDRKVWTAKQVPNGVELTLVSADGDMGFPGTLTAHVTYTLVGGALKIDYSATTDKATVVNLTNHAYFNLNGDDAGDILSHEIEIDAEHYTPVDATLIPTGNMDKVEGTPLDFQKPHVVGERINDGFEQMVRAGGYDHNWILNGPNGVMKKAATVSDPASGRTLTVTTTEPGVQFYTGNFLDGSLTGRHGGKYAKRTGFCLETQHYPDSPNHPGFPTTLLKPGSVMRSTTVFTFGVRK
jgi:aldose 1-epimerase